MEEQRKRDRKTERKIKRETERSGEVISKIGSFAERVSTICDLLH